MDELIGRRFGGRGQGRPPGLRRNLGGGWGGWWPSWPIAYYLPFPYGFPYGTPYAAYSSDVISGGAPSGRGSLCEDDVHEHPRRRHAAALSGNELFALLPILAPGASGLACQMDLDSSLQLHVSISVDGQRYGGSVDLSGLLQGIAQQVAATHARPQPGRRPVRPSDRLAVAPPVTPEALDHVSAEADRVVESAGLMLVGALYDEHVDAVSAGWFDKVKGGVLSVYRTASTPVTWLNKNVAKGLKKLEPAVTIAATAVATAYGGPAAGAAASRLTGPILDSSAKTGGDPTRLFDRAKKEGGGDPKVDQAVDTAQKAVAQTAAAYHLAATAESAAKGNQDAAGKLVQLEQAAAGGDDAAATALRVIVEALGTAAANRAAAANGAARADDPARGTMFEEPAPAAATAASGWLW